MVERTLSLEEVTSDTLRDEFVWTSLLEEHSTSPVEDDWGMCRTQELITDLAHSGDPSTYLTTPGTIDLMHTTNTNEYHNQHHLQQFGDNEHSQQLQVLPGIDSIHQRVVNHNHLQNASNTQVIFQSLDLSPDSTKLDEEFFASPDYSEASNDEGDDLASLEIHHNLQSTLHSVPSPNGSQSWTSYANESQNTMIDQQNNILHMTIATTDNMKIGNTNHHIGINIHPHIHSALQNHHHDHLIHQHHPNQDISETHQVMMSLPSMSTFTSCGSSVNLDDSSATLSNLTPLEPVNSTTSVIVQDAHAHCWGDDYPWDESRTLSMLDANLDFDRLIDLDTL